MNLVYLIKLIIFYVFAIAFDYVLYLQHTLPGWLSAIRTIMNGRPTQFRPLYALPVYLLLVIAVLYYPKSLMEALMLGVIIYGVFDFTVIAMFADIPLKLAMFDMVWGGIFFGALYLTKTYVFDL